MLGTYTGVKDSDPVDDGPVPAAFRAVTVQVYVFPSERPGIVAWSIVDVICATCPPLVLVQTIVYKDTSP